MKGEVQLEPAGERERDPTDVDPLLENQEVSSPGSSSEIYNEDLESGSIPCCRICLESDAEPGQFRLKIIKLSLIFFSSSMDIVFCFVV